MIKNIKEFYKFYIQQECSEVELNEMLLDMYVDKKISKQVFIEYLEITQSDVETCLLENVYLFISWTKYHIYPQTKRESQKWELLFFVPTKVVEVLKCWSVELFFTFLARKDKFVKVVDELIVWVYDGVIEISGQLSFDLFFTKSYKTSIL